MSYPQKAVNCGSYPRINAPAFGDLFTHKRSRFSLNLRINAPAFTHKRSRLYPSNPVMAWSVEEAPVSLPVSNNLRCPISTTYHYFDPTNYRNNSNA